MQRRPEPPEHPGEVLRVYMTAFRISQNALARAMGVSARRINEIVHGKRAISAETALGLGELIGPSAQHWLALQAEFDLESARKRRADSGAKPYGALPPVGDAVAFDDEQYIREQGERWFWTNGGGYRFGA